MSPHPPPLSWADRKGMMLHRESPRVTEATRWPTHRERGLAACGEPWREGGLRAGQGPGRVLRWESSDPQAATAMHMRDAIQSQGTRHTCTQLVRSVGGPHRWPLLVAGVIITGGTAMWGTCSSPGFLRTAQLSQNKKLAK